MFFSLFVHLWETQYYYFSLEVVKGCKRYELRLSVVSSKTTVVPNLHTLLFDSKIITTESSKTLLML